MPLIIEQNTIHGPSNVKGTEKATIIHVEIPAKNI